MNKILKLFIFTILLNCAIPVSAITLGTYSCPPFSMREDGEDIGLITEVMRKILSEAGVEKYNILEYPLARGIAELEQKRIDIFYPYITSSTQPDPDYILLGPIARYRLALFIRTDDPSDISVHALEDKIIGVERGSIADLLLSNGALHLERASQQISCLKMVLAERTTACALGELPGRYIAAINNIYAQIDYVNTDLYAEMYVLLGKNLSPEIIDKITAAYAKLKQQNYFVVQQKEYEAKFNLFIKSLS